MSSALKFRVRLDERDGVQASVSLRNGDETLARSVVHKFDSGAGSTDIPVNFMPSGCGSFALEAVLEISRAGSVEKEIWTAPLDLVVEQNVSSSGPPPISINITGSATGDIKISGGNAGDLNLGSIISDTARLTLPQAPFGASPSSPGTGPQPFRAVEALELAASPTRLTLDFGDRRLHLLARNPAWFGRQRENAGKGRTFDNAATLRVFAPGGEEMDAEASSFVSRTHFGLEPKGSNCQVRDGAPQRDGAGNIMPGTSSSPSSYGTTVDGAALQSCGTARVATSSCARIEVAPKAPSGAVLSLMLAALPDVSRSGACGGALLTREDAVPESYLALWSEVALDGADPALGGASVRWDGARLLLSLSGATSPVALAPGFAPPALGGGRVTTFSQTGI